MDKIEAHRLQQLIYEQFSFVPVVIHELGNGDYCCRIEHFDRNQRTLFYVWELSDWEIYKTIHAHRLEQYALSAGRVRTRRNERSS